MTFGDIATLVRIELGDTTGQQWTDFQLLEYINTACDAFAVDTGILIAPPVQTDVVAGTALYSLPAGCPGPHAIQLVYYDTAELSPTTPQAIARAGGNPHTDTGVPEKFYTLTDAGVTYLGLYKIPNASLINGLKMWYWKSATRATSLSSTLEIPDEYYNAVVQKATQLAFKAKRDFEPAMACKAEYREEVARARAYMADLIAATRLELKATDTEVRTIF